MISNLNGSGSVRVHRKKKGFLPVRGSGSGSVRLPGFHPAASCMNSHCQQYDLAVPHAGSDPLRRVRFTAGAYCI